MPEHADYRRVRPRLLDLFCGAGGLSLGAQEAGFNVIAGVDFDQDSLNTFQGAFPAATAIKRTLDVFNLSDLIAFDGVDFVVGGPPCQPYTTGGNGKQLGRNDVRDGLPAFIAALQLLRPAIWLCENVPGVPDITLEGWDIYRATLDAADYGTPQHRKRHFQVGVPRGAPFSWPKPTHGPETDRPWLTVGDTITASGHGVVVNRSRIVFHKNPIHRPSMHAGHLVNGAGRPLNFALPAPTICSQASGNGGHWVDCAGLLPGYHAHVRSGGKPQIGEFPGARRITGEEMALLQGFPPEMMFSGSTASVIRQIGNAVPPQIGAAIAARLLQAIQQERQAA